MVETSAQLKAKQGNTLKFPYKRALANIDEELKKELGENAKKVIMGWAFAPDVQRKIE